MGTKYPCELQASYKRVRNTRLRSYDLPHSPRFLPRCYPRLSPMSHSPLYPSLRSPPLLHTYYFPAPFLTLNFFLHCPASSHRILVTSVHIYSQMVTRMSPSPILTSSHLNCIARAVPILVFKPHVQAVGDLSPNIKLDHIFVIFFISFDSVLLASGCTSSLRAKLSRISPLSSRPNTYRSEWLTISSSPQWLVLHPLVSESLDVFIIVPSYTGYVERSVNRTDAVRD